MIIKKSLIVNKILLLLNNNPNYEHLDFEYS